MDKDLLLEERQIEVVRVDWINKYGPILITIIAAIVTITLFVGSRPDRDEVRQLINEKVDYRLQKLEQQNEKIIDILMENKIEAKK